MTAVSLDAVAGRAAAAGLSLRGAFHPDDDDGVPGPASTLILLGFVGGEGWGAFSASAEAADGRAHPLDRWSRRVIGGLADAFGASALLPFDGPPFLPFQRWALRANEVFVSPLGLLIHPDWGLWHSYRGALAFRERLALPERTARPSPCTRCADRPCLSACPVGAFSPGRYDVDACAAHIAAPAGEDCMTLGCRARRACPVGADRRYEAAQAGFHMRAFLAARRLRRS